jgi:hypothetical protein
MAVRTWVIVGIKGYGPRLRHARRCSRIFRDPLITGCDGWRGSLASGRFESSATSGWFVDRTVMKSLIGARLGEAIAYGRTAESS